MIGNTVGRIAIVETPIKQWVSEFECLPMMTSMHLQAAFTAFSKSLQFRWVYVQHVIPNCPSLFKDLECVIWEKLLPTVMGGDVSQVNGEILGCSTLLKHQMYLFNIQAGD